MIALVDTASVWFHGVMCFSVLVDWSIRMYSRDEIVRNGGNEGWIGVLITAVLSIVIQQLCTKWHNRNSDNPRNTIRKLSRINLAVCVFFTLLILVFPGDPMLGWLLLLATPSIVWVPRAIWLQRSSGRGVENKGNMVSALLLFTSVFVKGVTR